MFSKCLAREQRRVLRVSVSCSRGTVQSSLGGLSETYCWADPQLEHGHDQPMVRPTFRSSHGSCDVNISQVCASDNDIIQEVPVLGPRMHPGGFVFVFHLKYGIGDGEIVFSTKT